MNFDSDTIKLFLLLTGVLASGAASASLEMKGMGTGSNIATTVGGAFAYLFCSFLVSLIKKGS